MPKDARRWAAVECVAGVAVLALAAAGLGFGTRFATRAECEIGLVLGATLLAVGVRRMVRGSRAAVVSWLVAILAGGAVGTYFVWSARSENREATNAALLSAVVHGSPSDVERLLSDGADPEVQHLGTPVLVLAVARGDRRIVEALLSARASVNATGSAGVSPLTVARGAGNAELVRLLVAHGATDGAALAPSDQ